VLERVVDTRGDRFAMTVDGHHHTKRVDAGEHLQRVMVDRLDQTPPETNGPTVEIGTLAGLGVVGQSVTTIDDEIRIAIPDAHIEITYPALDWKRSEPANLITRLERQIHRIPDTLSTLRAEAETSRGEAGRAADRIGTPWGRADELAGLRRRQGEINETLAAAAAPDAPDPPPPAAELAPQSVPRSGGDGLSL
jgi:hypothetical protein